MEKKCSFKEHFDTNAKSFCCECKIFMCNKCETCHSNLFLNHEMINLEKNDTEIFTGFCFEENHNNKLDFFCKNHNQLCCAACITKVKKDYYGKHTDCQICTIEEIKEEKSKKLGQNIHYLEEFSKNIHEPINYLKNISEKITEKKENLKMNIQKTFTKLRNELDNREVELLIEVDNLFENLFLKEEKIKGYEKLPNKIKISLEKSKDINKKENKLNSFLNECIKIENIISDINKIYTDMKDSKKLVETEINFNSDEKELKEFIISIKKFGKVIKKGNKYKNFREINNEVEIIEHSKEEPYFILDIMMEKKVGEYSLFDGQKGNHFAIFDLKKKLYLKEILISVKQQYNCVLKHFKVSIKDDNDKWVLVNEFSCQDNKCQIDMQKFPIEKETQFVRIDFIDAWTKIHGDYILIRRLSFNVADII